jgi:hypothetical protein
MNNGLFAAVLGALSPPANACGAKRPQPSVDGESPSLEQILKVVCVIISTTEFLGQS